MVVWVIAAGATVGGAVSNDIAGPALLGGLVLIVMLIGFHGDAACICRRRYPTASSPMWNAARLRSTGAGDLVWDWDVSGDHVFTSPELEQLLGLKQRALEGPAASWLEVLHSRRTCDRFRATLDGLLEHRRGRLTQDFRLRGPDGHYLWFTLKARPIVGSDGEVVRLVGTLTDVTEFKTAEERPAARRRA